MARRRKRKVIKGVAVPQTRMGRAAIAKPKPKSTSNRPPGQYYGGKPRQNAAVRVMNDTEMQRFVASCDVGVAKMLRSLAKKRLNELEVRVPRKPLATLSPPDIRPDMAVEKWVTFASSCHKANAASLQRFYSALTKKLTP